MNTFFVKREAKIVPSTTTLASDSELGDAGTHRPTTIDNNLSNDSSSRIEASPYPSFHSNSNSINAHYLAVKPAAPKVKPTSQVGSSPGHHHCNQKESGGKSSLHVIEELKSESMRFKHHYRANAFDVWVMSMTTVLGGVYYGWNEGLLSGFGSYFIAQTLMGIAYIILICCLAEIISITSFSGGAYGMTRVVLGFYPGFIIAAFELLEYISYTSAAAQFLGDAICNLLDLSTNFVPLIALGFYLISAIFLYEGNYIFWRFNAIIGIICLLILVIYFFVSIGFTDFTQNASLQVNDANPNATDNWFQGGIVSFIKFLPLTTWGYGGIESAALVTDMIENPRKNFPRGLMAGVITLFIVMTGMMFVAVSLPSGGLEDFANLEYFMEVGWSKIGVSAAAADWLILPAQFAMGFGFILPSTRLIYAMAQSRLISTNFLWYGLSPVAIESSRSISVKSGTGDIHQETYHRSLFIAMIVSYGLCLIAIYYPDFDITNLPILCAFITYLSDLYAYIRLQTDFTTSDREFKSPFGIIGAIGAGLFFIIGIISILGFQDDSLTTGIFIIVLMILLTLYYFLYAKYQQVFSDQEQKTLLTLHVMSNNRRKRMKQVRQKWSQRITSFFIPGSKRSNHRPAGSIHSSAHTAAGRRGSKASSIDIAVVKAVEGEAKEAMREIFSTSDALSPVSVGHDQENSVTRSDFQ